MEEVSGVSQAAPWVDSLRWSKSSQAARSRSIGALPPVLVIDSKLMEDSKRDDTQDWVLSEGARPPLLSELVERIDEALATARAAEAAVAGVGASVLETAKQARRAAELAERATAAMLRERRDSAAERSRAYSGQLGGVWPASRRGPTAWWRDCGHWIEPRPGLIQPAPPQAGGDQRADLGTPPQRTAVKLRGQARLRAESRSKRPPRPRSGRRVKWRPRAPRRSLREQPRSRTAERYRAGFDRRPRE